MNAATTPTAPEPELPQPRRILIVEDEAVIAMDMAQHLREFGFEVVGTAVSGERARELAAERRPDLIMMDIVIKGPIDGIETARQIRARHDVPVVFLTAYGDKATLERAKAVAPNGYLLKPFRPNDLLTTIEVSLHRHGLERRVRESERWLGQILQNIADGVLATDPAGRVRFVNPVAEMLTGMPADAAEGRPSTDVFRLRTDDGLDLPDLLAQAMGERHNTPVASARLPGAAGRPPLWVDAGAAPIIDDGGRLLGGVLVFRDVTERRLAEQELRVYRERLEQLVRERTAELEQARLAAENASRAKTEFLSSMSHELRTPMNAIVGFSDLLASDLRDPRHAQYARHIHQAGAHLMQLIDDLLDLSTIEVGRLAVDIQAVMPGSVIGDAERLVTPQAAKRGIVLARGRVDDVPVLADPRRLRQVVVNLLGNAVKYNRDAGEVELSCRALDDDTVRIAVRDTGPGIPAERHAQLFRPFERLGAERTGVGGTGIGLAFSKRLAEAMGGALGFESTVGTGSTFWIDLRRAPLPRGTA